MYALQELGARQSAEMVRRYAHLSQGHLSEHVDRFADQIGLRPEIVVCDPATEKEVVH